MPHIEMAYTDKTGTTHPAAVFSISNVRLQLEPPSAEMEVTIYHDVTAMAAGKTPVELRPPTPLTQSEIDAYVAQFAMTAYSVLLARPEFSTGHVVVP